MTWRRQQYDRPETDAPGQNAGGHDAGGAAPLGAPSAVRGIALAAPHATFPDMLSRTAGYALHAALLIAEDEGSDHPARRAHEVAEALGIPPTYLAKILQTLARVGVLVSERGRNGGFRLARPAAETPLLAVVDPFDDLGRERQCLLGHGACSEVAACPAHREWREASAPAFRFFEQKTLADLMASRP